MASRVAATERVRRAIGEIGVGQERGPRLDDDGTPAFLKSGSPGKEHGEDGRGMVSNLLVVLCSDRDAQPVVNTGTLYQ